MYDLIAHRIYNTEAFTLIKLDLKKYVDNSHISINALSKSTGISRPTLTNMYAGKATAIQFETLETLCSFFNIGISDILKRIIGIENFNFIEMSSANLDINSHRIVGIQFERTIKNQTDLEVAVFIVSYDKKTSDSFNQQNFHTENLPKGSLMIGNEVENEEDLPPELKSWLDKTNERMAKANNPKRLFFSLEWIIPQELNSIKSKLDSEIIDDLKKANILMNYGETISLYRSFSKELLAEVGFRILVNFINNSGLDLKKSENYIIVLDWNLGTESSMNSQKYHFEYSVFNGTFMSLDSENDGISQQLEFEHNHLSPDIKKILYPNLSDLEK